MRSALAAIVSAGLALVARADEPLQLDWSFEFEDGVPSKLVWPTEAGKSYGLWEAAALTEEFTLVDGFPQEGTGGVMEHAFPASTRGFFKISETEGDGGEFVQIAAGSFQMGDQSDPQVGTSNELPVHTVSLSAYYIGKHEVTKALWDEVRQWAVNNGYTDLPTGGGKAADHPVHSIDWYEMVKWCNARSEKEGLTPCYTVSGATYRTGESFPECDWTADGYRLPTEAEWEKAARGGSGTNFSWGDEINHDDANYMGNSGSYAYDTSGTFYAHHPTYETGGYPYSSPVGSFAANSYGVYDMSGNMWEFCWDRYSSSYYQSSPAVDPRGASSGSTRVFRGGAWLYFAKHCRLAYRGGNSPTYSNDDMGFRLSKSTTP